MEYESSSNMEQQEKEVLKNYIREWIKIDNELKELSKLSRERREKKKNISEQLITIMKSYDIDCLKTHNDGMIMYQQTKVKMPLNKKHLLNALTVLCNKDQQKAKEMSQFILDTREEKIRESIKRKMK